MNIYQNEFMGGCFLSVYDETESDGNFHVCRKLCCDDTYILFQTITTRGYDDGFYLIPKDYIYRVDIDDEYTKRIEQLFHLNNQPLLERFCLKEGQPLLVQLLYHAKDNQLVTSLFLESGDDLTGWILSVDVADNCLCMKKLTASGREDGIAFVDIGSIEKIICNSGEERCIEMLTKTV